jgi:hypothetical protein
MQMNFKMSFNLKNNLNKFKQMEKFNKLTEIILPKVMYKGPRL